MVLQLQAADGFGDLADCSLVMHRVAGSLVPHQAQAFLDPYSFAGVVAVDLGNEAGGLARIEQDLVDLVAAARIDIPLTADIVHCTQHLRLGLVAVQADERRIGADHAAVEGGAEHALADVVVEVAEALLGLPHVRKSALPMEGRQSKAEIKCDGDP